MIKALILDLDNTIFPTASITPELFEPLHKLLDEHKDEFGVDKLPEIKKLMAKKAWQKIADQFGFSEELTKKGADILRESTYDKPIEPFGDYDEVRSLSHDKFLVTMGFTKMQQSKVRMLNLESDFKDISINDPEKTEDTKKEIFEEILKKYHYQPKEVLVIGDDPESEIEAGKALGIPTVLYDKKNEFNDNQADHHIHDFSELTKIIGRY
ncbi:HAD family hydrolase [Mucilaginibacter sp. CSA2-8R]|uniref:HAD family hydrolase n=1 Tax=Mucilaginibacter sp. CSA2-8R TaxID=3141542 RepID=UPI00315D56C5